MTERNEDRVRERAYAIWEKEGRPEGQDRRHWNEAEAELRGETTKVNEQARKQIEETETATGATDVPIPPPSMASPD
ncbi:hypothetical protein FHT78_000853 [Rhizobium sp. BK196]|jgi:hypothetical protein|uniref:DUF2934 domain-containing protein n=1 Tax=unclassified Rhizobium TaxID=2613769 RepID=UPI001615F83F|nr:MULTISPECIES: DUF2934 domain-containing protein [unclassified Rhizobium]MBB3309124.1 hypothetical protein [Rhizobium sp. BK196]MBB3461959.1 hypothetical protein [Rhizobium sp. BK377]